MSLHYAGMGGCVGKSGRNVWKKDAREGGQERGVENSVGRGDVEVGVERGNVEVGMEVGVGRGYAV